MNAIARILSESESETVVWPITIEYTSSFVVRSLGDGLAAWDTSNDSNHTGEAGEAIWEALNIDLLSDLLDKSSNRPDEDEDMALALRGDMMNPPEEEEEDWEGDDGLILSRQDLRAVIGWIDKVKDAYDWVRKSDQNFGERGFLYTANVHVSRAIGTWLKSVGVPFEYNV